jgi:hypothetical protein
MKRMAVLIAEISLSSSAWAQGEHTENGRKSEPMPTISDITMVAPALCRQRDIRLSQDGYSPSSFTYGIECRNVDDIEALSRVIGVRSIVHMPLIRTVRPQMLNPKPLPKLPNREDAFSLTTKRAVLTLMLPISPGSILAARMAPKWKK